MFVIFIESQLRRCSCRGHTGHGVSGCGDISADRQVAANVPPAFGNYFWTQILFSLKWFYFQIEPWFSTLRFPFGLSSCLSILLLCLHIQSAMDPIEFLMLSSLFQDHSLIGDIFLWGVFLLLAGYVENVDKENGLNFLDLVTYVNQSN